MIQTKKKKYDMDSESLRSSLPDSPGVYMFRDRSDNIIYIGKAKNLKKRVLYYFRPLSDLPHKTALMMNRAKKLDYILTGSENEAFILESSLIKRHMPRYNIILRDDKQYPCLRLSIKDTYPRLSIVRKIKKDGALYFGPFSSSHSVRSSLRLIDRLFRLRKCKRMGLPKRSRPCLNYQLDRCLGPCAKEVPVECYREIVDQVKLFLDGNNRELLRQLEKDMKGFSDKQEFEEAARIRDQIGAVKKTIERQNVVSQRMEDQDIIGLSQDDGVFDLVILFVRKGYMIGSRDYSFRARGASASEVIEAFLKQYYHKGPFIPEEILISEKIDDMISIRNWLSDIAGKKVTIHRPLRGKKLDLVRMAVTNAENLIARYDKTEKEALPGLLKSILRLKKSPRTIEGLDISNLQGSLAVGTVVSFIEDLPSKSGYRNYRIREVDGIDDYGMMSELAFRRLSGGKPPDLFVVDGGKGHLLAVQRVIENIGGEGMPEVVSIAKYDEKGNDKNDKIDKIYLAGRKNPLLLKKDNPVLLLLMRIRDEAHRRAISYHRKLRESSLEKSRLDHIPGIGPKKKRLLLKHFGDIDSISRARPEELSLLPGISYSMALDISKFFKSGKDRKVQHDGR